MTLISPGNKDGESPAFQVRFVEVRRACCLKNRPLEHSNKKYTENRPQELHLLHKPWASISNASMEKPGMDKVNP